MTTTRSLRATARLAAAHTAYYRQLFQETGLRPDDLGPDNWAMLPTTSKKALRSLPAAFVSSQVNPTLMATTTGTTGTPTVVWFSAAETEIVFSLSTIAVALTVGLRPNHVLAHTTSSRATLPLLTVAESTRRIGAAFMQLGTIDPSLALERLAAPVGLPGKAAQVTHLSGSTSYLAALVGAAETDGWCADDFGLESIEVGGEVLTDALRCRAEEAFGVRVRTGYLMTEVLPAGAMYCQQGHMHFPTEFAHVEFVDPETHQAATRGQVAMLVITPYAPYRDCTLLLRYATGDLVRVLNSVPTCELAAVPGSSDILGRFEGPLSIAVPTRSVLELLEAERSVPLPARFSVVEGTEGPVLHIVVSRLSAGLLGRLEDDATRLGLRLAGIVLHTDPSALPTAAPCRADLREHTFERAGRDRELVGAEG